MHDLCFMLKGDIVPWFVKYLYILDIEAEKKKEDEAKKDLETFWKFLDPVLNSGKHGSSLFDVARFHYLVKESDFPPVWSDSEMLVSTFWFYSAFTNALAFVTLKNTLGI